MLQVAQLFLSNQSAVFQCSITIMGGSLGLEVMGGGSCSKGREFESKHQKLDGDFFPYLFAVKFVMCL